MKAASVATREEIERLVAECLDLMDAEGGSAVEEFLARHAEHAPAIRSRLERLQDAGLLETPASAEPHFPERLGSFRLIERIGAGGMGVVYLAEQEPLGRKVALKLVRPDLLYFDGARERFRREIEVVARLKHPGIVPVYTVGEEEGIPFYAMEFVEGRSLDDLLRGLRGRDPRELGGRDLVEAVGGEAGAVALESGRPLAEATWVDACFHVLLQLVRALEHAHGQGVSHRDLKPSNVMLTSDVRVLLLDFGLASTRGSSRLTRTDSQVGSLAYMAPEQLRGQEADERVDLYAAGVTLYELLTLRLPYLARDPEETRRRILQGLPPPPREENAAVPWDAETVCLTAMEREAARRYPSARAFADDLRAVLRRMPIAARRPGALLRTKRFMQRNPARSTGVALGALLVVGSIVFGIEQRRIGRDLTRALGQKQDALLEARAGFLAALEATNEMLREVGAVDLRGVPRADELRRELLADAARFYEDLLARHPADPELRQKAATGFTARAVLQVELGDATGADASLARAVELLEGLREEQPLDPAVLTGLAQSLSARFLQLSSQGDLDAALAAARRAARFRRESLAALADRGIDVITVQARSDLATELSNVGVAFGARRRLPESLELLQESQRMREELVQESPESLEPKRLLGECLMNIGATLQQLGRLEECRSALERALALFEAVLQAAPDDFVTFQTHAQVLFNMAWLAEDGGDMEEAFALAERSLAAYVELGRRHPTQFEPAAVRVRALNRMGGVRLEQQRLTEAGELFDEALGLAEELHAAHPDFAEATKVFVDALTNVGMHRLALGRFEEAEELLRGALDEFESLCVRYPSACEYGTFQSRATLPLGRALLAQGSLDEARSVADAECVRMRSRQDGTPEREAGLAYALSLLAEVAAAQGDRPTVVEACRELATLEAKPADHRRAAGLLLTTEHGAQPSAEILELALDLLERSRRGKDAPAEDLSAAEELRALWSHPRFQELVARKPLAQDVR